MKTLVANHRLDFRTAHASLRQHKQSSKTKRLEISHRLPKFILFLDKRSLAITKDCKAGLLQIQKTEDRRDAVAFLENFGDGFAMQATVGGRLFHSEDVSMLEGDALDKRENSLKIAAKASLTSKDSFSIAASMSSGTEMLQNNQLSTSSISEGILWCGVGGDPSLHGDPRMWMLSMKEDKYRWKIIEKRCLISLTEALGRFTGYEWVPRKFEQLLRPPTPSQSRLALSGGCHIGLSSLAIIPRENGKGNYIIFQDEEGYIRFGYFDMNDVSESNDTLFADPVVRARHNTPLCLNLTKRPRGSHGGYWPISIIYVTEAGFLADQTLPNATGTWAPGSLADQKFQVASHSNLACAQYSGLGVCYEDPNGNLCLVHLKNGAECMDHGKSLNILPGTPLTMRSMQTWSESYLAIGFQDRDGRLMSLRRETSLKESNCAKWTLSEIVVPSVIDSLSVKPWTRSNCHLSLSWDPPESPPQFELAIFPDTNGRLVLFWGETGSQDSNPLCAIWENTRYTYLFGTLVYTSPHGQLECIRLDPNGQIAKARAIFRPHGWNGQAWQQPRSPWSDLWQRSLR